MNETGRHVIDYAAISAIIGTLIGWLPALAAALAIVWHLIRLYETTSGRPFADTWVARKLTGRA